jgi:hypothetical protein|tara:strand:- start:138 stop:896 length:759 start_codon:yes stop_codon:yes gene_type:complete
MNVYKNIDEINTYIYLPEKKEHLYNLTKNEDLLFLKVNSKSYYKSLLKSYYSGIIIKILDWDNDLLKKEYFISIKLKKIINFIDYISYFEFEDNFVDYINNINKYNISNNTHIYIDKYTDEKSVIIMHNYSLNNIYYIDKKNIINIYTQIILALYSAYINYGIYFLNLNNDFLYIVKNRSIKRYRYFIKTKKIYLNECNYKILISDLSNYNENEKVNIHDIIYNIIINLNIFNIKIEFTKNDYNNIKKKYIS